MQWYVGVRAFVLERQLPPQPRNRAFLLSSSSIAFSPEVIDVVSHALAAAEEGARDEDSPGEEGWDDAAALPCGVIEIAPAPGT